MNDTYITITELAQILKLNNNETFKLINNNFDNYLIIESNTAKVKKDFVNRLLKLKKEEEKNNENEIEKLKEDIKEKDKKIDELQNKLEEYTSKAFELAQSALNIQQQLNYITASNNIKKKSFIKRIFKKGIDE